MAPCPQRDPAGDVSVTGAESHLAAARLGLGIFQVPRYHAVNDLARARSSSSAAAPPRPSRCRCSIRAAASSRRACGYSSIGWRGNFRFARRSCGRRSRHDDEIFAGLGVGRKRCIGQDQKPSLPPRIEQLIWGQLSSGSPQRAMSTERVDRPVRGTLVDAAHHLPSPYFRTSPAISALACGSDASPSASATRAMSAAGRFWLTFHLPSISRSRSRRRRSP